MSCLDFHLVLHPGMRTEYFTDPERGDAPELAAKAENILEHMYRQYVDDCPEFKDFKTGSTITNGGSSKAQSTKKPAGGFFAKAIRATSTTTPGADPFTTRMRSELDKFFSGAYSWSEGTKILDWWKVCCTSSSTRLLIFSFIADVLMLHTSQAHSSEFPVLARIARDILAIPGVSVAVERLFSHCRKTLTEARSSLAADSSAKTVVCKDLLKLGLGDKISYLEGKSTHD